MRFVIQRVNKSSVEINKKIVGEINQGLVVFIGIEHGDTKEIADTMINKMIKLRIFSDDNNNKMNLSLNDIEGELLLISQFTLYANCKRGNRPDFMMAAQIDKANELYEYIVEQCKKENIPVQTGIFGEDMKVKILNDGPVTIILDSKELLLGNRNFG